MSNFTNVFVYGTLKRGQSRTHVLSQQQFLGEALTRPHYLLVDLGQYPGLILPTALEPVIVSPHAVQGELYRVDDGCLAELDRIECVNQNLYARWPVSLEVPENVAAQTYLYQQTVTADMLCGPRWPAK